MMLVCKNNNDNDNDNFRSRFVLFCKYLRSYFPPLSPTYIQTTHNVNQHLVATEFNRYRLMHLTELRVPADKACGEREKVCMP